MKIGFNLSNEKREDAPLPTQTVTTTEPIKSLVDVYFPESGVKFPYYNDSFDLHKGDLVYVDGKFEGEKGRVVAVYYTFKINLDHYKRVVHKIDTTVKGELFFANGHMISFERDVIPKQKLTSWFLPPQADEVITVEDTSATFYPLHELNKIPVPDHIIERGEEHYMENRVVYVEIDGERGYAIVDGTKPYELEFSYRNGSVTLPLCPCFCSGTCKHQVALLLQLRETIDLIESDYKDKFDGYFALLQRDAFFSITAFPNKSSLILK